MFNLETGKIMVVEDERVNREVLGSILRNQGHQVLLVEDGEQALDKVGVYEPDLVLTDLMMPKVDGFELVRRLCAAPQYQHIPVIMVTSLDDRDSRVRGLEEGAADFIAKPVDAQELIARVNNLLRLKKLHDFLRHNNTYLKEYDALTGLPNGQRFQTLLDTALGTAHKNGEEVALLLVNVGDTLKKLNDSLGRKQGDMLLQSLANRLVEGCPQCTHIARTAPGEFTIILQGPGVRSSAEEVAAGLLQLIVKPLYLAERPIPCTANIGVALYPLHAQDSASLVRRANLALHGTQAKGVNLYQFFNPAMDALASERFALESALQHALEQRQFQLYYQPQVELAGGRIVGAEALIRWWHPEHGWISPDRFVPLAEELGLIHALGDWILETACREWQLWQAEGFGEVRISINLSLHQFRNPRLFEDILRILERTGTSARALGFEITESCSMDDVAHTEKVLSGLSALGAKTAIDDFGTGYSSLAYLTQLPLHILKIDRSFVKDLPHKGSAKSLVAGVVSLAHGLGLQTIAEGVETEAQLAFLREQGCEQVQGYVFSPPVTGETFRALLKEKARRVV